MRSLARFKTTFISVEKKNNYGHMHKETINV